MLDRESDAFAAKTRFQWLFALIPGLNCSLGPSLLFGALIGEWGSNAVWGSYFGLGWCLAAFWSGDILHDRFSATIGLAWGWAALLPLYFGAGWLWDQLDPRGRGWAIRLLSLSSILVLPARTMLGLDACGIHLPDYGTHLAMSF